jgi:hypothetical protein
MDDIWFEPHSLVIKSAFILLLIVLGIREAWSSRSKKQRGSKSP